MIGANFPHSSVAGGEKGPSQKGKGFLPPRKKGEITVPCTWGRKVNRTIFFKKKHARFVGKGSVVPGGQNFPGGFFSRVLVKKGTKEKNI